MLLMVSTVSTYSTDGDGTHMCSAHVLIGVTLREDTTTRTSSLIQYACPIRVYEPRCGTTGLCTSCTLNGSM